MDKELLDKYKIRDYYMIPTEIVDNVFYEFETQLKKQKEIIDKIRKEVNKQYTIMGCEVVENWVLLQILEDKEVKK